MRRVRLEALSILGLFMIGMEGAAASYPISMGHDQASHDKSSFPVLQDSPPSLNQPPVADGIVDRYLLHPRGDVNGLLLDDGSQMHVTYRAAQQLVTLVQPGDRVRVHGRRVSNSPLVKPDVIVNVTDGTTFTVPPRLELPIPPSEERPAVHEMKAAGTIQVLLYDHLKGVVNGMVLSDGTQVRLPPDVGEQFHAALQKDMDVVIEGYGTAGLHGRAMEATAIGRKGRPLTYLDASTKQLR
ncbi:MAG TPA: hypothetical protein VJ746_10010 [Nitrospira sp.]|nr:hypothetical protein [Nitrospira sp.]